MKSIEEAKEILTEYFDAEEKEVFAHEVDGKAVGLALCSLRHYLTCEGYKTWGHIGFGVRPSERRKGYATQMLKMMLEEAKKTLYIMF